MLHFEGVGRLIFNFFVRGRSDNFVPQSRAGHFFTLCFQMLQLAPPPILFYQLLTYLIEFSQVVKNCSHITMLVFKKTQCNIFNIDNVKK